MRVFLGFVSIASTIGIIIVGLFHDNDKISDIEYGIWLFFLFIIISIEIFYSHYPHRTTLEEVRRFSFLANNTLKSLVRDYYDYLHAEGVTQFPQVRVNVMLKYNFLFRKRMRIFYFTNLEKKDFYELSNDIGYSDDERDILWRENKGVIGKVIKSKHMIASGEGDKDWSNIVNSLTDEEKKMFARIKSVCSFPILDGNDVIAIINIDSNINKCNSLFDNPKIRSLMIEYENKIKPLCPLNGVKLV